MMAVVTGARRGELLALRWRDVDLEAATALVGRGKNGEPRVLPLTALVIAETRRHSAKQHPDSLVFCRYDPCKAAAFSTAWRTA